MRDSARPAFIYDLDDCIIHYERNKMTEASTYLIENLIDDSVSSLPGYLRGKFASGQSYEIDERFDGVKDDPEDSFVLTARPYLLEFAREETEEITSELGFPPENVIMFPGINLEGEIVADSLVEPLVEKTIGGNFIDYLNSAFGGFSEYKEQVLDEIEAKGDYNRLIYFDNSQATLDALLSHEHVMAFRGLKEFSL